MLKILIFFEEVKKMRNYFLGNLNGCSKIFPQQKNRFQRNLLFSNKTESVLIFYEDFYYLRVEYPLP